MLFLHKQRIVFLSVPKTASTSIEHALLPFAGIAMTASPALKHMGYVAFMRNIAPLIRRGHGLSRSDFTVIAIMREPVSWVHSWYRYRSRGELKDPRSSRHANYCGHLSFSQFVRDYCSPMPPPHARIGTGMQMLLDAGGRIGVDRIFAYENLQDFTDFMEAEIGSELDLPDLNRSPPGELSLEPDAEVLLRRKLDGPIRLHSGLRPDGRIDDRHGLALSA